RDRPGGDGRPIDPTWDEKYVAGLSDNQTMTYLLAALVGEHKAEARAGRYWVTCAIARPFHATTEFHRVRDVTDDAGWKRFFADLARREQRNARCREEP